MASKDPNIFFFSIKNQLLFFQLPHGQQKDVTMNSPSKLQPSHSSHCTAYSRKQNKETHYIL